MDIRGCKLCIVDSLFCLQQISLSTQEVAGIVVPNPLRRDNPPSFICIMTRGIAGSQVTLCEEWRCLC